MECHASCKNHITETKLLKPVSHKRSNWEKEIIPVDPQNRWRHKIKFDPNTCFIPGRCIETTREGPLHKIISTELDANFRWYATNMNDTKLLSKHFGGDLIVLEAKYHNHWALMYHNHVRYTLCNNNRSVFIRCDYPQSIFL